MAWTKQTNNFDSINSAIETLNANVDNLSFDIKNGDMNNSIQLAKSIFNISSEVIAYHYTLNQMFIEDFRDESIYLNTINNGGFLNTRFLNNNFYEVGTEVLRTYDENNFYADPGGNVSYDNTIKKFGNGSLSLDGTADTFIETDRCFNRDRFDQEILASNFVINTWIYFNSLPTSGNKMYIWTQYYNGNENYSLYVKNTGGVYSLNFEIKNLADPDLLITRTISPSIETWHHIRFNRGYSNTLRLFFDGILLGSGETYTGVIKSFDNGYATQTIGAYEGGNYLNAKLDDFEITIGNLNYTSDFTLPTSATIPDYNGTTTTVLLQFNETFDESEIIDTTLIRLVTDMELISEEKTVVENVTPTYVYMTTKHDESLGEYATVEYFYTINGGVNWRPINLNELTETVDEGTTLQIKIVCSNFDYLEYEYPDGYFDGQYQIYGFAYGYLI
jgi:hypothetical protein